MEPVFLLAPPRSYSTVSVAVLAGHPGIFGFPEMMTGNDGPLGALLGAAEQGGRTGREATIRASGIARAVAEIHHGEQSPAAIARARAWLADHWGWTAAELLRHLLALVHPLVGLEKSPETAYDDNLGRCQEAFPQARFIHLTRHPVTTLDSMRRYWSPLNRGRSQADRSKACASSWFLAHTNIVTALRDLPPDRWMRVRAEDLLREPQRVGPAVYDWLGLDYDAATIDALTSTECWRFAHTGESGSLYGGDPSFLSAPRLRAVPAPPPVAFPPDWALPDRMCRRMADLAHQLGYP